MTDTMWMLMARYQGLPIVPVDTIREDYFPHLTLPKFLLKISNGAIKLPVVKMEDSQKSARGIHLHDLAIYLDERTKQARHECELMYG